MITADYGNQDSAITWAQERLAGLSFRDDAKTIAFTRECGSYAAVIVYDGFSQCDCNIHVVSDGSCSWMTRQMLSRAFAYPFVQLGLRRVTGLVPKKNKAALNMDLRLGFEIEGLCRNALPDDDVYVMGMLREHCQFIPQEYRNV